MTTKITKAQRAAQKNEAFDGLREQINALMEKRAAWEHGTYAASNSELYSILGDCLDLFIKVKSSYDLPKGINSLLDTFGITYNNGTSLELKIVRLVFAGNENAERIGNRLFGYARVIRVAMEAKQTGATLAEFISSNHGIEEIRRAGKDGVSASDKQKRQIEFAESELFETRDDELLKNFVIHDDLQPADGERFSLALIRKNADGTGSIVFGTNNVSAVKTILSIAGKKFIENTANAAQENAFALAEQQKAQNFAAAAAALKNAQTTSQARASKSAKSKSADAQLA